MVYRIPTPGNVIPQQSARTPRFLDAAVQQQAQANALREGKEREKQQNLAAAVSLIGSAGGDGGWLEMLGMGGDGGGEEMAEVVEGEGIPAEDVEGMGDAVAAATSIGSLMSGNPLGLIGLKKLFD